MKRMPELFTRASERLLPWLERRARHHRRARPRDDSRRARRQPRKRARRRPARARRREDRRPAAGVDPRQPRADPGRDVLPVARLEHGSSSASTTCCRGAGRSKVRQIAREIDDVLAEFLRGQLLVMLVLAVYYALALWAVGLDHAFAIGILTGLLVFIPYVGFGLGLVLGMVAALLQWSGLPFFLSVLAVYGAGQLLENYVLIPVSRRRSHRLASGRGDLRAARVRPAVRLRRRAARAAALRSAAGRACVTCARRTPTRRSIATSERSRWPSS